MRQISLTPYQIPTVEVEKDENGKPKFDARGNPIPKLDAKGEPIQKFDDFNVRTSLANILFHDGVGAREAIVRDKLAKQIEDWPNDDLLVEEADWTKLVAAIDHLPNVARGHVEFVTRVIDALKVEVQPKALPADGPKALPETPPAAE